MKNNIVRMLLSLTIIGISFFNVTVKADTTCTYNLDFSGLMGCNVNKDFTIVYDSSGEPTINLQELDNEVMNTCSQGLLHSAYMKKNAKNYFKNNNACPKVFVSGDEGMLNFEVADDGTALPEYSAAATLKSQTGGGSSTSNSSDSSSSVNKTVCTYTNKKMRNESWTVDVKFKIVNGVNKIEVGRSGQGSSEAKADSVVGLKGYTFGLSQDLVSTIYDQGKCPELYFALADNSTTTITMTDKQPDASLDGSYSVTESPTQNVTPRDDSYPDVTYNDIGNVGDNFCSEKEVKKILKFFGVMILLLKVIVPIIIIIKGMFLFYNVVIKGGSDDLVKNAKELGIKILIGLLIFFIPSVLEGLLNLYNGFASVKSEYTDCATCLLDPTECNTN